MPEAFEELIAEIGADLSKLDKGLKEASTKIDRFKQGAGKGPSVSSPFDNLGKSLENVGKIAEKTGKALTVAITLPLALLAKKAIDVGFDYERAMNTFQAVTKASAAEMERTSVIAEKLGADMTLPATSAADAALAMTELAKGGFSAQQSMDAARGALQLAAAAQIEEAKAAEITTNAINTFGLAAGDASRVADLLAASANASSGEITDMAAALQQSGAGAAALKIPIEDLVTAISEMANAGIKGSDAGTSLKTFMNALTPDTEKAARAMKQLGIDAFDVAGNFVGLETVIRQAAPALAKMTDEQKANAIQAAFGSDAQRAANIILGQGVEKFIEMKGAVTEQGAAAALAAAKTKGLSGAWDGFISQVETALLKAFKAVQKDLEGIVRWLASLVEKFSQLSPQTQKTIIAFAGVAAAIGPLLFVFGKLTTMIGTVSSLIGGSGGLASIIGGLGIAGGPLAIATAAVAAFALAYATDFGNIQTETNKVIKDTIIPALKDLGSAFGELNTILKESSAVQFVLQQAMASTGFVIKALAAAVETSLQPIKAAVLLLKGDWQGAWDAITGKTKQAAASIKTTVENILIDVDKQKLYREAQEIGFAIGSGVTQGNREGLEKKSPTRVERDILEMSENVIKILADGAIKGGKAAQKYAEEIKKAFSEMASGIAAAVGGSLQITTEIWAKLSQDDRKVLGQIRREHERFEKDMTLLALKEAVERRKNQKDIYDLIADDIQKQFAKIGGVVLGFGNTFKSMVKTIKAEAVDLSASMFALSDNVTRAFDKNTQSLARNLASLSEIISGGKLGTVQFAEVELAYRKMAEGINQATQLHIAGDTSAGILKLRDTVKELVEFWNQKGQEWGLSTATISKQIRADLDNLIAGLPEEYQKAMREVADAMIGNLEHIEQQSKPKLKSIAEQYEELEQSVGQGMAALVKLIGDAFGKSLAIVSEKTEGILQIIGNLPGKIGDKLRGATNEFTKWVNQIDGILRGLHKIFDGIPDGLGKAIEKIIGIFKAKKPEIDSAVIKTTEGFEGFFGKAGEQSGGSFVDSLLNKVKGLFGGGGLGTVIAGGLGALFGGLTGGGGKKGVLSSLFGAGGAALGAQIGTAIFPGIGTAIGAAVGGLASLFGGLFGGKSKHEKEMESLAAEKARAELRGINAGVVKALEESKQAMLETASRAAKLFDELLFFTKVPRKIIKQFIRELGFLFTQMADGLKALSPEALAKIKEASEALQPAADLLAALPLVFEGISKHIPVGEARIKSFFFDFGKVVEFLGVLAEETANKTEKQIKKFSERLQPAAELLAATVGFLKDMFDIKPIPIGNFDVIEDALIEITNRVGALAERMDKQFVKVLSWFAERAAAGVAFWREGIAVVKEMVDIPRPTEADFKSLFSSLETGLNESIALAARLAGEAFDNSVLFWERATVLFETVRAGMDIVNAISEIQQVGKEKWSVWTDNIQTMIDALNQSVNLAEMGVDLSWRFWDATRAMRENIDMGLENLKTVILAANQALSFLSQIGAQAGLAGAGNINLPPGFSGFGPSSNVTSTTNTGNTYIFNGITLTREQARGMTVEELADGIRTGARVGGGLR